MRGPWKLRPPVGDERSSSCISAILPVIYVYVQTHYTCIYAPVLILAIDDACPAQHSMTKTTDVGGISGHRSNS
jgi:hypothetical protein